MWAGSKNQRLPYHSNARHVNNAAGHDSLVDPPHDRHGGDLQLLLPGLMFLYFGTKIEACDGGVDLGLAALRAALSEALRAALSEDALSEASIFSVVFSSERVPSSLESFCRPARYKLTHRTPPKLSAICLGHNGWRLSMKAYTQEQQLLLLLVGMTPASPF